MSLQTQASKYEWADLKTFRDTGKRLREPFITISRNGSFVLNTTFIHKAKEEMYNSHVLLSYSKHNNAIVFEFINSKNYPGAIKLTKKLNTLFAGKSFLKRSGLQLEDVAGRYEPHLMTIPKRGDCWVIFLGRKLEN